MILARRLAALLVLAVIAVVVVIIVDSGGNPYVIKLQLADADGLRQDSPVAVGGQDVGTISMSVRHHRVIVTMNIDRAHAPVGRNATASVTSVNLLGQKRILLEKGDVRDAAPSGYVLPASQVTVTTDLDQVLDVLTPDVRARLAILVNEAGQAFTGRRADFSAMLEQLPGDFNAGSALIGAVAADNHTLGDLVQSSDGFVTQLAQQRAQLVNTLHAFGQASATVETKRAQLAATLQRAPGTLATLQTFLGKLQRATVPLGPAARDITATAPALDSTLIQIAPFTRLASPTLREATAVAPQLTQLATGVTPVVHQAVPVVAQLASFSQALAPVSGIVDHSVDNIVAILQNWSRAIQFRDGLSHVFRGEASITPQVLTAMITQLQQAGVLSSLDRAARGLRKAEHAAKAPAGNRAATRSTTPSGGGTTSPAAGPTGASNPGAVGPAAPSPSTAPGTTGTTGTTTPGSKPGSGSGLAALLSFLLKP
jgi:phospholipid/cholesterol/gamma-HCH transport system substrate-binding protein